MSKKNNNYECKRCFYQCYQLNDMKKHLNKKIICQRTLDSYNYKDNELIKLSLIRKNEEIIKENNKENNFLCDNCNKNFCSKSNLIRHKKLFCKKIEINNKDDETNINNTCISNIDIKNDNIIYDTNNIISVVVDKYTDKNRHKMGSAS
jgi:hypothetical protein